MHPRMMQVPSSNVAKATYLRAPLYMHPTFGSGLQVLQHGEQLLEFKLPREKAHQTSAKSSLLEYPHIHHPLTKNRINW